MDLIEQHNNLLVVNHQGQGNKGTAERTSFRLLAAAERWAKEHPGGAIYHDFRELSGADDAYADQLGICFRKLRLLSDFTHVGTISSGMLKVMISLATRKGGIDMQVFADHEAAVAHLQEAGFAAPPS